MILCYTDHMANKRTYLAWVSTALAQHDVSIPCSYDVAAELWGTAACQRFHATRDVILVEAELHSSAR